MPAFKSELIFDSFSFFFFVCDVCDFVKLAYSTVFTKVYVVVKKKKNQWSFKKASFLYVKTQTSRRKKMLS